MRITCESCHSSIPSSSLYCPNCGSRVNRPASNGPANRYDSNSTDRYYDYSDIMDNKLLAALSYFGVLLLAPLLLRRDSPYVNFHLVQGINLLILDLCGSFVMRIIRLTLLGRLHTLIWLSLLMLHVIGIINALSGKTKELPVIDKFKLIKTI
ncbi:MAG: hypothetical protein FWG10_08545 [Eubacteriaceae bacterium]|nr:hypothetical protein [Eubacteriaceae bacterium]